MRLPQQPLFEHRATDAFTSQSEFNLDTSSQEIAAKSSTSGAMIARIDKVRGLSALRNDLMEYRRSDAGIFKRCSVLRCKLSEKILRRIDSMRLKSIWARP
jgi:hypothetical protein